MSLALSLCQYILPKRGLGKALARPRPGLAASQSEMKDVENPQAPNCLIVVHSFHSNQGRCNGLDKRVPGGFLTSSFFMEVYTLVSTVVCYVPACN